MMAIEYPVEQSCYVYRLVDKAGELVYVGMTVNPGDRIGVHRKKSWWPEVDDVLLERFSSVDEARAAEARAIRTESPRCNIQGVLSSPNMEGIGRYVMVAELVSMFGVSRQAVDQWTRNQVYGFPAPHETLRMGRIWRTADIVKWAEARGREIHE